VTNAVQVSKLRADAVMGPPQDAVSVSKLRAPAVFAPPQTAVSVSKIRAYAIVTSKVIILADYTWPQSGDAQLVPQKAKLSLIPYNITGGQGFTNVEQVIGNTPGRWRLDLSGIAVNTDARRLQWEALEFALRGRSKTILMPIFRWRSGLVPWPTIAGVLTTSAPGYTVPVIRAFAFGEVQPGANTLTIRVDQGAELKAGHIFSIDEKIYAIVSVDATGTTGSSPVVPTYTVTIVPPIREHIDDVAQFNFDNPTLRCRLSDDNAMAIEGGWDYWKSGNPSLTFWEDVTTPPSTDSPGDSP
jgi:hypothetical protein